MKKVLLILLALLLFVGCENKVTPIEKISGEEINNISGEEENLSKMVDEKISQMTLEEKIEQMLILDYSFAAYGKDDETGVTELSDSVKEIIENHNIGGIILFRDNTKGTEQTLRLVNSFQQAATINNKKQQIPLFMCIDEEGGRVNRLATGTAMPGNMALGAINDYETSKEYAKVIGEELNALGFNVDFAPVMDVNNNPDNPIIGVRSFSSNPEIVAKMGEAFIDGLHEENIAASLKHFPGHGDTSSDSHTGLPLIDKSYNEIKDLELIPFKAGIANGADMVMTAHIVYPQIETTKYISKKDGKEINLPATLSKTILTGILRNELGFEGVIVTDALNMGAITEHIKTEDVTKYALNAGVDILLMPVSLTTEDALNGYVNMIVEQVNNSEIPEENINASVKRILLLKQKTSLLDEDNYQLTDDKIAKALKIVGSKEHHEKELEISKKAITLVKGEELLPVQKDKKVLFLTAYENDKNSVEYAIQKLKEEKVLDDSFEYEVVDFEKKEFKELKNKVDSADSVVITSDVTKKSVYDVKSENGWQGRFIDSAIAEIHKQNKKVAVVSCMLPYDAGRYTDADIIVCAYNDRTIQSLDIKYNGETPMYGVSVASAIIKLFDGKDFVATLPVEI